jgi:hypothetical protein
MLKNVHFLLCADLVLLQKLEDIAKKMGGFSH